MNNILKILSIALVWGVFYSGGALADDDVAALVVDNGSGMGAPVSAPEPTGLALLAGGLVGMGVAAYRKRRKQ